FQAVGGLLYFTAHTPSFGYELWRSDGTFEGTYIVKNINLVRSSYPESPANVAGTLFFYADDGRVGDELWALAPCGDGVLNPGEECDDGNVVGGDGCSERCRVEHETDCGNCRDDDADGLVDMADPDCCATGATLTIDRLKVGRHGARRNVKLAGTVAGIDSTAKQDIVLQLHPANDEPICAHLPADHLRAD